METYRRLTVVKSVSQDLPVTVHGDTLEDWAIWMKSAGMSIRTITARMELINLFATRMTADPVTAGWQSVAVFLADDRFSAGTRQTYLGHFRAWFHYLIVMDVRADDPTVKLPKGRPVRRRPRPVTSNQLAAIMGARMHLRTGAMIVLGSYEGFRVHEIAKFDASDIIGDHVRVMGKGGFYDELPLHPLVAEIAERMPKTGLWFESYKKPGEPLLANSVSTIVGNVMRRSGMPENRTAHSLRHFFGTELRRNGADLALVQRLMRHANIASTVMYTDVDDAERRAAVLALPVPARLRLVA